MVNNENMEDLLNKLNDFAKDNNISQDSINNIFSMFNNGNESNPNYKENNVNSSQCKTQSSVNNIDFETIMKMKTIIDNMNTKDDPRSNLLKSLKPYLNESRKSKVDQYIGLMNMSKVMDAFPFMNGGKSNGR